jgi:hypothetical protein
MLLRTEESVQADTDVEIRLELPVAAVGADPPEVSFRGRVVRTVSPSESDPWPGSAIAIEHYNFLRPSADLLSLSGH